MNIYLKAGPHFVVGVDTVVLTDRFRAGITETGSKKNRTSSILMLLSLTDLIRLGADDDHPHLLQCARPKELRKDRYLSR